ncbi:MAG: Flp family type IVb pilin [Blastopirellula sp. JB062]
MRVLNRLWSDESGFVNSAELVLLSVILVIGMIVGLAALRDSVVQELTDTGQAVGQLDQSYRVEFQDNGRLQVNGRNVRVESNFGNVSVVTGFRNFGYNDQPDLGQAQEDVAGEPPGGIDIGGNDLDESGTAPSPLQ